jgi:hypothetical protein
LQKADDLPINSVQIREIRHIPNYIR